MEDVSSAKVCDEDGLVSRSMTIEAHGHDHEGANLDHSRDQQHRVRLTACGCWRAAARRACLASVECPSYVLNTTR